MQQQHFFPTVGLLSSDAFLYDTFPRIAAMFPTFLGHVDALPANGDYYVSPHAGGEVYLMRGKDGNIRGFRNSCPHRNAQFAPVGAVINDVEFPRSGKAARDDLIRCPWHAKGFNHLGVSLDRKCDDLHDVPLEIVGCFIFEAHKNARMHLADFVENSDFKEFGLSPLAEIAMLRLYRAFVCDEPYTAATGMAIFGDDEHVNKIHKGTFNAMVSMRSLRVRKGKSWSMQIVDWKASAEASSEYAAYIAAVLAICKGKTPKIGAIWMAFGANTTFEWYQCGPDSVKDFILVASTYIPKGRRTDIAIEIYAPPHVSVELLEKFEAAYMKTAREDGHLCTSVDEGQLALTRAGNGEQCVGPMEGVTEECVAHYYDLLERCFKKMHTQPVVVMMKTA